MLNRAVFLDRDGTIIEEVGYLKHIDQLRFIDGAPTAIGRLNRKGFKVVVFTNQAGVARGFLSDDTLHQLHAAMEASFRSQNAHVDAYYYCPHHPTEGGGFYRVECNCRKPKPGMLKRAAQELGIDLPKSFVVGDKISDLEAGYAVNCRLVLVRTGYGRESEERFVGQRFQPEFVAADLLEASQWILQQNG